MRFASRCRWWVPDSAWQAVAADVLHQRGAAPTEVQAFNHAFAPSNTVVALAWWSNTGRRRASTAARTLAEGELAGAPTGQYGPTVQAITGLIRSELEQSVRETSAVMTAVLHVPMSTGMVAKTQDQVSRALAAPYQEALEHARCDDRAHADETSWREDKKKAWMWVSVTCAPPPSPPQLGAR